MSFSGDFNIAAPPPYSPFDPHPSAQASEVSNLSTQPLSHHDQASLHISGTPYFEMHPPPRPRPRKLLAYCVTILPFTRPEEIAPPMTQLNISKKYIDEQDWNSFLNHLFPYNAGSLNASSPSEKAVLQEEHEKMRCERLKKVVDEWNEGFFLPRSLSIILQTERLPQSLPAGPSQRHPELGRALYDVVKKQDVATARLLLTYGANPDYRPSCATPALTEAVNRGKEEIVQMIVERGPDLEARAPCAETALYAAVSNEKVNILKLLLKYGAQVNGSHPSGGDPALYLACRKGYIDIVHTLLDTDVDVDARPPGGCTALFKMVEKQRVGIVELLLRKGAKAETRAPGSASAMYLAAEKGNVEIVRLLLENGAEVDSKSPGGNTALFEAVKKGDNLEMIRLLLRHGANVYSRGHGGGTPIDRASKKGMTELVKLLLDHSLARRNESS